VTFPAYSAKPNKWAQFSDLQLRKLLAKRSGGIPEQYARETREVLLFMLENQGQGTAMAEA
jgi:hypothetical protein